MFNNIEVIYEMKILYYSDLFKFGAENFLNQVPRNS